jgi:hypothetical protein
MTSTGRGQFSTEPPKDSRPLRGGKQPFSREGVTLNFIVEGQRPSVYQGGGIKFPPTAGALTRLMPSSMQPTASR